MHKYFTFKTNVVDSSTSISRRGIAEVLMKLLGMAILFHLLGNPRTAPKYISMIFGCMLRKSLHNLLYPSPPMRTIDQVTITCIYNNHVQFPTFFRRLCSISIKLVVCFNFNPFLSIFFLIIYLNFEIHSWCSRFLFLFHCIL
ncbi:hypothetical protein GLYMA_18G174800v4 [Glycine max]|nr:hypothetical protein GLYMA_18G174800v4 [Glycine max]KAH1154919.1 hypothetical protein GYH30_050278 [Glycine max]